MKLLGHPVQALKCYNNSIALLEKSPSEKFRLPMLHKMVFEMTQDPELEKQLANDPSEFDLEFLTSEDKVNLFGENESEEPVSAVKETTATILAGIGLLAAAGGIAYLITQRFKH